MKYPEYLNPPHVIAWRLIWFVPAQLCRIAFVFFVTIGWGVDSGKLLWRDTR